MTQRQSVIQWGFIAYAFCSLISMATMSIGAAILGATLLIGFGGPKATWNVLKEELRYPDTRIYLLLSFALTLACALSLITGSLWPVSFSGKQAEFRFFPDMAKAWYLFWPIILVAGLRRISPEARWRVLQAWLWTFALTSVIGLIQYFSGWPRMQAIPGYAHRYHVTLFLGHHLSVASILIFPLFAALELGWKNKQILYYGMVLLGLISLVLTFSKILWIVLPIGLVGWVLWALPRRTGVAITAVILFAVALGSQHPSVQARYFALQNWQWAERSKIWSANWEFFKMRPLTGVGWMHNHELATYYQEEKLPPGSFIFTGHAHNNLLQMMSGTGLIGTLAWLAWSAFVVSLAWRTRRDPRREVFALGLLFAWLVFHLNGMSQVNSWEGKVQHQMMWVVAWTLLWRGDGRKS